MEEAVRIALMENPDLQARYEELEVSRTDLVQAGLLLNPRIDAELKFLEGGAGGILEGLLVQPLTAAILLPRRRCATDAALAAKRNETAAAAVDLAGRTRRAYYALQAAGQRADVLRSAVLAARGSVLAVDALRDAGNVRALDRDREHAFYEQLRADLAVAQLAVHERRERLNQLMGLWGPEAGTWSVEPRLPDVPTSVVVGEDVERRAVAESLDLAAQRFALIAMAHELGVAQVGSIVRDLEAGLAFEREPDGTWATGPAVAVELPLFDFGQARVPRARAMVRGASHRYVAEAIRIRSGSRLAAERVASAVRVVRHHEETLLPLRQRVLEETQKQVNAMQIGIFELLAAKRAQIDTGLGYVEALDRYWDACSRLDQYLAGSRPAEGGRSSVSAGVEGGPSGGGH